MAVEKSIDLAGVADLDRVALIVEILERNLMNAKESGKIFGKAYREAATIPIRQRLTEAIESLEIS
ncbi:MULTISPECIES: hypothetical protein [unclassified Leptolyngbya]|uniref:hypothetical protein n=1 Tax=unclassified Leptolyngbya TaxID=2650499 RepID=UPI0016866732|nr:MULTISPECIES: hypothetical protein [unclassified Leptolyngbya]MBD1911568.1 hypothetical protein [Leptolyngbya sp. FACHB-8]MBD2155602.1 hypothetical protein [Leptolyngbya sp. FACHB-16]